MLQRLVVPLLAVALGLMVVAPTVTTPALAQGDAGKEQRRHDRQRPHDEQQQEQEEEEAEPEILHHLGAHAGHHVLVRGHGEAGVRVAEPFGHHL